MMEVAKNLKIKVTRNGETVVSLAMPARCARWIKKILPKNVHDSLIKQHIDIDQIQANINKNQALTKMDIFTLQEEQKNVKVWLE